MICFKTSLSMFLGRTGDGRPSNSFPLESGGFLRQRCHLSPFECRLKCASGEETGDDVSDPWGVMMRAIVCRRVVGIGSDGHVVGQVRVKSVDNSISARGINEQNGGREHVVGCLHVGLMGFLENWQLITANFSVEKQGKSAGCEVSSKRRRERRRRVHEKQDGRDWLVKKSSAVPDLCFFCSVTQVHNTWRVLSNQGFGWTDRAGLVNGNRKQIESVVKLISVEQNVLKMGMSRRPSWRSEREYVC